MITSLRLVNFKNFADETLRLGPFTVIVGANATAQRKRFPLDKPCPATHLLAAIPE